ncbi:MAG TPA: hypothetical protein VF678_13130, partial [bacterium]
RYRPRYAVDVQILTPAGEVDPDFPVLTGLAVPGFGTGDGRGIFAFPGVGTRVRVGFDYGLPTHPYLVNVITEGRFLPALQPGELLIAQQDGSSDRSDGLGNRTLQSNGTLTLDVHRLEILADEVGEELGTVERTVDGQVIETLGDHEQTIMGGKLVKIGGDRKTAILGVDDVTIAGDKAELIGGKAELVAALGLKLFVVPGTGKVYIGNGVNEVLTILDTIITQLQLETHTSAAPGNPTSPPLNLALYLAEQVKLALLKTP